MSKFRYKFSPKILLLAVLGAALAVTCLVWNIVRLVKIILSQDVIAYAVISVAVAIFMSLVFLVLIAAMLIDSSYVFEKNYLTVKFGFIKTGYKYSEIKQIVWFKENNKLTMFHEDESFTNVVISDNFYREFADELIKRNDKTVYFEDLGKNK